MSEFMGLVFGSYEAKVMYQRFNLTAIISGRSTMPWNKVEKKNMLKYIALYRTYLLFYLNYCLKSFKSLRTNLGQTLIFSSTCKMNKSF